MDHYTSDYFFGLQNENFSYFEIQMEYANRFFILKNAKVQKYNVYLNLISSRGITGWLESRLIGKLNSLRAIKNCVKHQKGGF